MSPSSNGEQLVITGGEIKSLIFVCVFGVCNHLLLEDSESSWRSCVIARGFSPLSKENYIIIMSCFIGSDTKRPLWCKLEGNIERNNSAASLASSEMPYNRALAGIPDG
ncbi:hypothetical protein MTR67_034334 [Solanum verrucosum]|uniref:Uncharacterized protein n=1 Tax=Solanum verrucosum TaxID=315347 RepID=A0AAF0U8D9_SOLVR|nr:hypothetical protein MTR67_034334 [Solanum verrucosum]